MTSEGPPFFQRRGLGVGNAPDRTELRKRARDLRNEATPQERALWSRLKGAQLAGFRFRRQAAIPPYIADFLCPTKALVIELDGLTHEPAADAKRDAFLAAKGYTTLRFTNQEVGLNLNGVLTAILHTLKQLPDRWPYPQPPSLKGRALQV